MSEACGKGTHIMAKPVGAFCNLNCTYCFYLEKQSFYETNKMEVMSDTILEQFISNYLDMNKNQPEVQFVWQGGEPMLAGLGFYKKVVKLQKQYGGDQSILNSLQTNGVELNDEWCEFLKEHKFHVGISIDGGADITGIHRVNKGNKSMFEDIMRGIRFLQKYNIPFTALACVTRDSCEKPLEVYNFFKDNGIHHMQFTPVVERVASEEEQEIGLTHSSPQNIQKDSSEYVTEWSVPEGKYGDFLNAIYDEWVSKDVGSIIVQNFEWSLASWMGLSSNVCIFTSDCSGTLIIEHNGDVYDCDHYMYPENLLGNIMETSIVTMANSQQQVEFGCNKGKVSERCRNCEVFFACQGECPRHRFVWNEEAGEYESYLCADYKKHFRHIHPKNKAMVQLIQNGIPASKVMELKSGLNILHK